MNREAIEGKGLVQLWNKKYCMELKADEIWTVSDVSLSVPATC